MTVDELYGKTTDACRIGMRWKVAPDDIDSQKTTILDIAGKSVFRVGITGEFNTGKSTLINVILGTDVVATGSAQGTTTIPFCISHDENSRDFTLYYTNGKTLSYSSAKQKLLKLYMPQAFNNNGWADKQLGALADLLGKNDVNEEFFHLLHIISTTDDADIDHIHLKWPVPLLGTGVMVYDMPGFDSFLYEEHRNRAIHTLAQCDVIIITVSPDKHINSELLLLLGNKELLYKRVFFALTMIDTQQSLQAIADYKKTFSNELQKETGLFVTPELILCPSMLYMVRKQIVNGNMDFSQFSNHEQEQMIAEFEKELQMLFYFFSSKGKELQLERAWHLLQNLIHLMTDNMSDVLKTETNRLSVLLHSRKPTFNDFIGTTLSGDDFIKVTTEIRDSFLRVSETQKEVVAKAMRIFVHKAPTKSEAQSVFKESSIIELVKQMEEKIYSSYLDTARRIMEAYSEDEKRIAMKFKETYQRSIQNFDYKVNVKDISRQLTPLRYSTWKMTTVPMFRYFTSRKTINLQLDKAITAALKKTFDKSIRKYYTSLSSSYKSLEKQRQLAYKRFCKNESRNVSTIIANENQCVAQLQLSISALKNDICNLRNSGGLEESKS